MRIGEYNDLRVLRDSMYGLYLGDEEGEVLLPNNQCLDTMHIDDIIRVFVYTDSEDRPIATRKKPIAVVGEFAKLKCVTVNSSGAFLEWGLDKDLFCPPKEQSVPMEIGKDYVVRVYLDEVSGRPVASSRLRRFTQIEGWGLRVGQPIRMLITELGHDAMTVIVNDFIRGSLFKDEWVERLQVGDVRDGFVKAVRKEDGRVAVSLRPQGYAAVLGEKDRLIAELRSSGGRLPFSDQSTPEEIQRKFGLSKGAFKKLIGTLYKEGVIELEAGYIRLK